MIPLYSELAEAGHSIQVRSKSASTGRAGTHFFVPFSRTDLLRRGFASCFVSRASNAVSDGFILGMHVRCPIACRIAVQLRTQERFHKGTTQDDTTSQKENCHVRRGMSDGSWGFGWLAVFYGLGHIPITVYQELAIETSVSSS
jgi:hypothetical protein